MFKSRHVQVALSLLFGFLTYTAGASAHDLKGILVQQPASATPEINAALGATATADVATRSVINNLRLWPVPRKLTICFIGASSQVRKRVVDSMRRTWPLAVLTDGRLDFDGDSFTKIADCGASPTADIRVAFTPGDGYWSYVGVESTQHLPSMNLQGFTETVPTQSEVDRLVGHETGHALGLEHEHQSPASPLCGWNFPYIYKHYQWKSEQEMHDNFDKLQDYVVNGSHAYIFSTYDQKSLMHYDFEPSAFIAGDKSPCFISQNKIPSDQDKNALKVAYGPGLAQEQARAKNAAPSLTSAFSGPQYSKLRQLVKTKLDLLK